MVLGLVGLVRKWLMWLLVVLWYWCGSCCDSWFVLVFVIIVNLWDWCCSNCYWWLGLCLCWCGCRYWWCSMLYCVILYCCVGWRKRCVLVCLDVYFVWWCGGVCWLGCWLGWFLWRSWVWFLFFVLGYYYGGGVVVVDGGDF